MASTVVFDIKPVANWDDSSAVWDATDDIQPGDSNCSELWKLTATMIACVEMQGDASRKFDTSDTVGDFILDYTTYKMHAKFGETSETDTAFKFNEIDVNFADLLAAETNFAHFGYSAAGLSVIGSLFAMLG